MHSLCPTYIAKNVGEVRYAALKPTLCTTCIHLEAPNASKSMHVVHSVGFMILLVLGRHTV